MLHYSLWNFRLVKLLLHIKEMNLGSDAQFGFRFEAPVCLSPFLNQEQNLGHFLAMVNLAHQLHKISTGSIPDVHKGSFHYLFAKKTTSEA